MQQDIPTEADIYRALVDKLMIPTVLGRSEIYYVADPEMELHTLLFRPDVQRPRIPAHFAIHPQYLATLRQMVQPWQQLLPLDEWRPPKEDTPMLDLVAIRQRRELLWDEMCAICASRRRFTMSIPVQVSDTDQRISAVCSDVDALTAEVERLCLVIGQCADLLPADVAAQVFQEMRGDVHA